ncbi:MAG: NAD(P)-dependent oxidoreductase [Acidobacteria bacterium]|nr:NAD(P)-dependent oxidoreductase [Acidobacteriota bacterium]
MSQSKPVVALFGADGQLSRAIAATWADRARVHGFTRAEVDITDAASVQRALTPLRPDIVVNGAAYNNVDEAQERQGLAMAVNGLAPGILARAADAHGAVFVHYSTDFVFAGTEDRLWTEDDAPEPQSVYAQSKLMGEWLARDCAKHYVLRVESLFGGDERRSTIDRVASALAAGRAMPLFIDRTVTPSFVDDVAAATWQLVSTAAPVGVYHAVNSGATTWMALGRAVAQHYGYDERLLTPVKVADVTFKAPRPQYAALDNAKIGRHGAPLPPWTDALTRYLARRPA